MSKLSPRKAQPKSLQVNDAPLADQRPIPLELYDCQRYGPLVGVSDEGSAAQTIVDAAYLSAKALAFSPPSAMIVGMIVDGERMTSAGEVPIGPDEYSQIVPVTRGKTFGSTNVGTRVSTRLHQPLPEFVVSDAHGQLDQWLEKVFSQFAKFIATPDKKPRPLTVRLVVHPGTNLAGLREVIPKLEAGRSLGRIGPASLHRLSILVNYPEPIRDYVQPIRELIQFAAEFKVPEVAVDGPPREAARRRLSVQGLLNVLEPPVANNLLAEAARAKVRLAYRFEDDPESASRTVWTGQYSAHANGLNAAKYGLTPLLLDQQREVVTRVQRWMKGWTAVPAFYVDTPLVTADRVYENDQCVAAAKLWMDMVSKAGAKVILVDAPDRINPRRLLKADEHDGVGVLTMSQVEELNRYAGGKGLRVLWSGGIQAHQALGLAKLGVFGIFTTGSTAQAIPVSGELANDPATAASNEPTLPGVRRIHALVQAGFLYRVLGKSNAPLVRKIDKAANVVLKDDLSSQQLDKHLSLLNDLMKQGWRQHWGHKD